MGGHFFDKSSNKHQTRKILRQELYPTIEYLSFVTGIPTKKLCDSLVGSSAKSKDGYIGRKGILGDIDIAIDENDFDINDLYNILINHFDEDNVKKISPIVSVSVPINGKNKSGYVQVDFIIGNDDLIKFLYSSPDYITEHSNYKGAYRNLLIQAMLQEKRDVVKDNEEIIATVGPVLVLNKGIVNQFRHRPKRKDNNGYTTKMVPIDKDKFIRLFPQYKAIQDEYIIEKPKEIISFLFPEAKNEELNCKDLDSFEKLLGLIGKYKSIETQEKIIERAKDIFKQQKLSIPTELFHKN